MLPDIFLGILRGTPGWFAQTGDLSLGVSTKLQGNWWVLSVYSTDVREGNIVNLYDKIVCCK